MEKWFVLRRQAKNTGLRTIEANRMFIFVSNMIKKGGAEGNLFIYGEN